jgi:outer membrane protein OmpA-like peptidoglycan-associated protein
VRALAVPRWAISFADLGLLLLGCFVLLHAMEAARPHASADAAAAARQTPGDLFPAAALFQPGEARLTGEARAMLRQLGTRYAGRAVQIASLGTAEGGHRLDRFELSAARTAAVARALQEGGVPEQAIAIRLEGAGGARRAQAIAITSR